MKTRRLIQILLVFIVILLSSLPVAARAPATPKPAPVRWYPRPRRPVAGLGAAGRRCADLRHGSPRSRSPRTGRPWDSGLSPPLLPDEVEAIPMCSPAITSAASPCTTGGLLALQAGSLPGTWERGCA